MPEEAVFVYVLDLRVGNRGLTDRAPVDDAAAAVDVALLIEAQEDLLHGLRAALVHREALSVPVRGGAKLLQLVDDAVSVLFLPVPTLLEELLSAELFLVSALFFELLDDLDFRRDGRVVRARLPECGVALHSAETNQDILHRIVERMAHVQLSRDVRRRHDNAKRLFPLIYLRVKITAVHPALIELIFNLRGSISLRKYFHIKSSLISADLGSALRPCCGTLLSTAL